MEKTTHTNPDGSVVTIWRGLDAIIGSGVRIGLDAIIGNGAVIGNDATIGNGVRIGSGVRIGLDAIIGSGAIIGDRAIIGHDARIGTYARIGDYAARHAVRGDGYVFTVGTVDDVPTVWAGCRTFSEPEARHHWGPQHPRHAETVAILDFLFGSFRRDQEAA